jgi:glycine/D-amino acid oxidase-like deaminating enzyme
METTWQKNWEANKQYPTLEGDIEADVVIVGGGITGITLAYQLATSGKKVVVLNKGTLKKSSYTAYTTAMIMAEIDTTYPKLVKMFGAEQAAYIWLLGMEAINNIEEIIKTEDIDCEFAVVPAYIYANNAKEWDGLKEEAKLLKEANFPVEIIEGNSGDKKLEIPNTGAYILTNQAKFHPLKYCDGLRVAAEAKGAKFFEKTAALEINGNEKVEVITKDGKVKADFVIVATYEPFNKPKELFAKKGMYTSYMCELSIPKNILTEGLYVDAQNPYHYFRVDAMQGKDRMIVGGADHRQEIKMNPEKNYAEVLEYAEKILGGVEYKVETKWDGGILETVDGLPLIGRYSREYPNRLVATGYSGNGMTYSMIATKILTDIITGENKVANPFEPLRPLRITNLIIKGKDYLEEFFRGAAKNIFRKPGR